MTAKAVLQIDADTSGLLRAFGQARAQAKVTADGIAREFVGRAGGAYRASGKAAEDSARRASTVQVREAQRVVSDYLRGESQKRRAAELTAQKRAEAEKKATEIARDEAHKRGLTAEQEAQLRARTMQGLTRIYAAEERKRTQSLKREAQEREQVERGVRSRVSGALGTVGRVGVQTAQAAHGLIQDARRQRAGAERTLGQAVRNAGGSERDVSQTNERVRRFVSDTGMSFEDVAQALSVGQARGSSLEAGRGETRMQAIERSLALVREANAEGADPGQYLAARGRLAATGLRGDALKTAMRFALSAAQSGQVEVDQIIQQGLPGASRLMDRRASALTRNTGETAEAFEARQQAVRLGAWRESVATQEVLAASGGRAGHTANTLASLQNFLSTPRRQEMALTNIRTAESQINTATPEGRARAASLHALYEGENALFERDPTRRGNAMRLKSGVSPIEFATRIAAASGGNAQAGANLFAGGGHGNPQSFLANMRDLMGVLGGERGQRIQAMMSGSGVTDEQVTRHENAVENDALAQLTRAQERGLNALTDNTSALVQLSTRIADFQAENPIGTNALGGAGGALGSLLGGGAASGVGSAVARLVTGGAAGATGTGGAGATVAAVGAGGTAGLVGAGLLGTFASANALRTAVTGEDLTGNQVGTLRRVTGAALGGVGAAGETGRQIADAILEAFRTTPPQVVMTSHEVAVASGNANASRGQTPRPADL